MNDIDRILDLLDDIIYLLVELVPKIDVKGTFNPELRDLQNKLKATGKGEWIE